MQESCKYPATLLCDFYKVSHREQYPENTEKIYSTWTPRQSLISGINGVVAFGFQAFIKQYLINYFNENFFSRTEEDVVGEYKRVIKYTLGNDEPDASHIAALHKLGYLPIKICAVPEGMVVPIRCPMLTIENTMPEFFWLTNYFETIMSSSLWLPATSATIAREYRKILEKYYRATVDDRVTPDVDFQAHDFSMRGMSSLEAAKASGAGHLLSFSGTDTIPAILLHEEFYNADISKQLVGSSIPATEHSVMCAYGQDEVASYKRLMTEVYPSGFFSVVSDTWNLWDVVTKTIPQLKDVIMSRDGRVVIRPDSGDPVKILCGDPTASDGRAQKGVVELLWELFGGATTEQGYKSLDTHIGVIYGDAITLERCENICSGLMSNGFASSNVVFGVGSYTYQYNTRDTFGFALKATYGVFGGEEKNLFKNPVTDSGVKKSQTGKVCVLQTATGITYIDGLDKQMSEQLSDVNLISPVFENGALLRETSLQEIRARLKGQKV